LRADEKIEESMEDKIISFRNWMEGKSFTSSRLVHYVGVDKSNAKDVALDSVSAELENSLSEGFLVDWHVHQSTLYLCIQEPGCPMPALDKIIAEEAIENVEEILCRAGLK
jgi:hypothetical protein